MTGRISPSDPRLVLVPQPLTNKQRQTEQKATGKDVGTVFLIDSHQRHTLYNSYIAAQIASRDARDQD